ncbi:protein NRT1/ PTR FAMILY 8.3-like [Phoenix dactylifera]|uniref:Protein NRT1/ PTR FAMILY 8.3-like n=1 Tax=Phoenix dactylifera TaxID=42345 RepID=A0A8B7BZW5_PHODC|nr:protein NRT1/ PTR FAMILY 8.3-like [Phoenix dactylifera]
MEHEDSVEKGEARPLLSNKSYSSSYHEGDRSLEVEQQSRSQQKPSNSKAPAIILGFNFLDSAAFNGIGANLVVYLHSILHVGSAASAAEVSNWTGTSYSTSLIGAVIADSYLGNYKTILFSHIIYLIGMVTITFFALSPSLKPPACEGGSCPPANGVQKFVFFSGLYLVAFGSGGVKSALLPFGADQFDDEKPAEKEKKGAFFSLFYLSVTLGFFTSGILIVWIQINIDWALGFGIATFLVFVALWAFLLGTPSYRMRMPTGSPLKSVFQVLVAAFRKRNLEVPRDVSLLYEEKDKSMQQRLAHTNEFRFLDKAATVLDSDLKDGRSHSLWRLCPISKVEELKILLRLLPIWATGVIYSAACVQLFTTFIQQGTVMDTRVGSVSIPPASLGSFEVICVMVWVIFYDKIIGPATKSHFGNGAGLSQLQRMGIGRVLIILTMATAAYVEMRRLERVKAGEPQLSILWQLPQLFIQAGSDVFSNITQLEFFYGQAPESMKSLCTALALLSISLGSYLSSLVVTIIAAITTGGGELGWMPDDLNKGHLDYYFLAWAGLCALNFFIYLAFARKYTLKKVISGS